MWWILQMEIMPPILVYVCVIFPLTKLPSDGAIAFTVVLSRLQELDQIART